MRNSTDKVKNALSRVMMPRPPSSSFARELSMSMDFASTSQSNLSPLRRPKKGRLSSTASQSKLATGSLHNSKSSVLRPRIQAIGKRTDGFLPSVDESFSPLNKSTASLSGETRPGKTLEKGGFKERREGRLETVLNLVKAPQEKPTVISVLSKHYIFGNFSKPLIQKLAAVMKVCKLPPNEIVFKHAVGCFFILLNGTMEVVTAGRSGKVMVAGDCFGEMEVINDATRAGTVRTLEPCVFAAIDKQTFHPFLKAIRAQDISEKRSFIDSIEIFSELASAQKDSLAAVMIPHEFGNGEKIVKEGEFGDLLYIIREGSVVCYMKGVEIRRLGKGDFFGEQALLYGGTRAATVIADSVVKCMSINRANFVDILNDYFPMMYLYTVLNTFKKSAFLCHLPQSLVPKLISVMTFKTYSSNRIAIPKGTPRGYYMWLVLRGSLVLPQSQKIVEYSTCVGDLDFAVPPTGTYEEDIRTALGSTVLAKISRGDFLMALGATLHQVARDYEMLGALRQVQLLTGLDVAALRELVLLAEAVKYKNGEEIVEQNTSGECFYIIKSGQAHVRKDGMRVRTITKYDYFGERPLLFDEPHTASVVAMVNVSCWVIKRPDFQKIMTPSIRQRLFERVELQSEQKNSIKSLVHIKLLGSSRFGYVHLVAHKDKSVLYALKTVTKVKGESAEDSKRSEDEKTEENKSISSKKDNRFEDKRRPNEEQIIEVQKRVFVEKEILSQVFHPFIVRLLNVSEDEDRHYFLLEFVNGLSLQDVRAKVGTVSDEMARFYAAGMLMILEYLHERGIMHRNLDLANIVVDDSGYLKLIDFAIAKLLTGRAYSIVGPPHSAAPEVIRLRGYTHSAEFFSLGILMYKFICGRFPFADDEVDMNRIFNHILRHNLTFPEDVEISEDAKSFIERLLTADPRDRLNGGVDSLKSHPWFKELEWVPPTQDKLERRELRAPFIPPTPTLWNEVAAARTSNQTVEMIKVRLTQEIEGKIADSTTKKKEE